MVLKVAVKPLSQSFPMEMRNFLSRTGKMCDLQAAIVMCRKVKRAVWVDCMMAPLGRPKRVS